MTDLSDNVQSAITSAVQSASIHMDYVGDLQHGYHRDAKGVKSTDTQVKSNTSVDNTKQQEDKNASGTASTAIGLPDPSAVASAIDHEDKKVQDADEEPGVASTAIGLPASEGIINAMKEGGDDNTTTQSASTKEDTPLSNTTTLEKADNAARDVVDKSISDSQDGPGPNSSKMKHQQQQPEKSCPSRSLAASDQTGNDDDTNSPPSSSAPAVNSMKEPTHTLIDEHVAPPNHSTPVEPVVENIVANIESVEEPVVEEEVIRDPPPATMDVAQTLDSTRPTPADVKTEDLPNVEVRAQVLGDPVAEHNALAGQMVVTEDPAADEIKVEQVSPAAATITTTTASDIRPTSIMEVADIKTEDMPVAEEPATIDDIKMKRVNVEQAKNDNDGDGVLPKDEPIKKDGTMHGNDVNVEQQPRTVDELADKKDDGECAAAKENNASPSLDNTATESDNIHQQPLARVDGQSQSLESKSHPAQTLLEQQNHAPAVASQEQSNAVKSSKCAIM